MPPKTIANYFKPASGTPPKRTMLSDAARRAILNSKDEPPAKRAKTLSTSAPTATPAVSIPRAASREELRKAFEAHPTILPLVQLELDTLGEDWLIELQDELTKPYFLELKKYVVAEQNSKKVFPPAEDIYSWSRLCPLKDVRVVIVGQDPYHGDGQAHGLAFSVRKGVRVPPSLRNMYKEMSTAVPGFVVPPHGDLTEWAKHGVLLLNTALTVRAHEAGSHATQGWDKFTLAALRAVTARLAGGPGAGLFAVKSTPPEADTDASTAVGVTGNGVVFMAWGAHAAKMVAQLDTKRHLVLKSAHPSPLSASRGFFGNGHFKKSNEWLVERYGKDGGIDWKALGAQL